MTHSQIECNIDDTLSDWVCFCRHTHRLGVLLKIHSQIECVIDDTISLEYYIFFRKENVVLKRKLKKYIYRRMPLWDCIVCGIITVTLISVILISIIFLLIKNECSNEVRKSL